MRSAKAVTRYSIADFDRLESRTGVVAGLVPATPIVGTLSKNNRGGRDKPGHDAEEMAGGST
jgi:hypothetical protein